VLNAWLQHSGMARRFDGGPPWLGFFRHFNAAILGRRDSMGKSVMLLGRRRGAAARQWPLSAGWCGPVFGIVCA